MVIKTEHKRYFLIEFKDEKPKIKSFYYELKDKFCQLAGQIGLANAGIYIMDWQNNYLIIKSNQRSRYLIESSLNLLNYHLKIKFVTGTIKKIDKRLKEEEFENDL